MRRHLTALQVHENVLKGFQDGMLQLEDLTVESDSATDLVKQVDRFWSTCGQVQKYGPLNEDIAMKARESQKYWNAISLSTVAFDAETDLHRATQARTTIEADLTCCYLSLLKIERGIRIMRLYLQLSRQPDGKNMAQRSRIEHLFYWLPLGWQELCLRNDVESILDRCEKTLRQHQEAETRRQNLFVEVMRERKMDIAPFRVDLARELMFFRLDGL